MEKRNSKRIEKGKGALAGRGLTSGPLAEAGLARPRSPPSPRPCRVHARGRPRRAAVASRQSSTTAWRTCGDLDAPWSATRCARPRPPLSPLPFAPASSSSLALSLSLYARRAPPSPLELRALPRPFSPSACAILRFISPQALPSLRRCRTRLRALGNAR